MSHWATALMVVVGLGSISLDSLFKGALDMLLEWHPRGPRTAIAGQAAMVALTVAGVRMLAASAGFSLAGVLLVAAGFTVGRFTLRLFNHARAKEHKPPIYSSLDLVLFASVVVLVWAAGRW